MDIQLIIEGVTAIIFGVLAQSNKINELFIKSINKFNGVETKITPTTYNYQRIVGIIAIISGIILLYFGLTK
ncbi:MAG: hypothetical protein QHH09_03535 [Microgenomates group bacterium]|nr:hypothetical protein [Microgenomates group bacterium]